jgi:predicted outer membrane protein
MSNLSKRALRWAAPVAVVAAIGLAACGDADEGTTRTVAPKSAVSDSDSPPAYCRWTSRFGVHLEVGAAEIARCRGSEEAVPARPSG